MKIKDLKPKSQFIFNGIPLIVQRVERTQTAAVRLHVRLDGYNGSVTLDGTRCVSHYAARVANPSPPAPRIDSPFSPSSRPCNA